MGAQPPLQFVGMRLAAEEEMVLIRFKGAKARKRVRRRLRSHCPRRESTPQTSGEWSQCISRESVELRDNHGLVGAELFLDGCPRRKERNSNERRRLRSPVAGALLQFPQLAAQPAFAAGAIEDQRRVAVGEILLVILPDLAFVALEDRLRDFESLLEEILRPGRGVGGIPSVIDQRQTNELVGAVRGGNRARRTAKPFLINSAQILETGFQEIGILVQPRIGAQAFPQRALPFVVDPQGWGNPHQARKIAARSPFDG